MTIAVQIKDLTSATTVAEGDYVPIQRLSDSKVVKATALQMGAVQSVTVDISSAQFLDLYATPVTVLAASAGQVYVPVAFALDYRAGTEIYASGGPGRYIQFRVGASVAAQVLQAAINGWGATNYVAVIPLTGIVVEANSAITLTASGGSMTNGNGTFLATVWYTTYTL